MQTKPEYKWAMIMILLCESKKFEAKTVFSLRFDLQNSGKVQKGQEHKKSVKFVLQPIRVPQKRFSNSVCDLPLFWRLLRIDLADIFGQTLWQKCLKKLFFIFDYDLMENIHAKWVYLTLLISLSLSSWVDEMWNFNNLKLI